MTPAPAAPSGVRSERPDPQPDPGIPALVGGGGAVHGGSKDPGARLQGGSKEPGAQSRGGRSEPAPLVDQGGRPLGPRAVQTRQRILEATVELLDEKSMRDLRVIDIARRIGTSPATFYQYFKDVEDVVVHLASESSERTPELVELIEGEWRGEAGYRRAQRLVNHVIDHWKRYAPILRVRNNASDEGDDRFRRIRLRAMMPMLYAFEASLERERERPAETGEDSGAPSGVWEGARVHPTMAATALTSILERLAMYTDKIEELGGTREDLVATAATLMQFLMTSRR